MHILEMVSKERKFSSYEVIAESLTALLARMSDYATLSETDENKSIIESWRNEIYFIRSAVEVLEAEK
jgi:hypothetical protein